MKISGDSVTWERTESAGDPDTTFPGSNTLTVTAPTWGVHCLLLQLLVTLLCSGPIEGYAGCTSKDLCGSHFLEKILAETQTVIELCSFGSGTILPHLEHMAGELHPTC